MLTEEMYDALNRKHFVLGELDPNISPMDLDEHLLVQYLLVEVRELRMWALEEAVGVPLPWCDTEYDKVNAWKDVQRTHRAYVRAQQRAVGLEFVAQVRVPYKTVDNGDGTVSILQSR